MDVKLPAGGGKKELRIELYDFDSSSDHDFLGAFLSPPASPTAAAFHRSPCTAVIRFSQLGEFCG